MEKNKNSQKEHNIHDLPVVPYDEPMEGLEQEPPTSISFEGKRVLLVEPEMSKFEYYENMLRKTNISVIQAGSLQQWFDWVSQTKHIDIVIVDVDMFKEKNAKVLQQIQTLHANPPMILIVREYNEHYLKLIQGCHCDTIIEEPVDFGRLIKAVEKCIG